MNSVVQQSENFSCLEVFYYNKMAKEKACKNCKMVYEGTSCPNCQSTDSVEGFKGKISVIDPEQSEIAKHAGIKGKGVFAVRLR